MNYGTGSSTLQTNGQYVQEVTVRGERESDYKSCKAGDNNLLAGVGSSQSQVGPTTSSQAASTGH